ncbi:uncharacterized protein G2W53_014013 [Senna tora]|uniref:Uncharacterized protein n=1 Tax=Senna tora TaxID=362788 RepID=A0A834WPX4_9FABA|nr:uncharacterized protein G2W53_014013 [Senna tora]
MRKPLRKSRTNNRTRLRKI